MPWLEDLKFPRGYQMGTHNFLYNCRFFLNDFQSIILLGAYVSRINVRVTMVIESTNIFLFLIIAILDYIFKKKSGIFYATIF